jgi:hypothetical protein
VLALYRILKKRRRGQYFRLDKSCLGAMASTCEIPWES